jgi:hypothetical protein
MSSVMMVYLIFSFAFANSMSRLDSYIIKNLENGRYKFLQTLVINDDKSFKPYFNSDLIYQENFGLEPLRAIQKANRDLKKEVFVTQIISITVVRCGKTAVIVKFKDKSEKTFVYDLNEQLIAKG